MLEAAAPSLPKLQTDVRPMLFFSCRLWRCFGFCEGVANVLELILQLDKLGVFEVPLLLLICRLICRLVCRRPAAPQVKASVFGKVAAEVQRKAVSSRTDGDGGPGWSPVRRSGSPPSPASTQAAAATVFQNKWDDSLHLWLIFRCLWLSFHCL